MTRRQPRKDLKDILRQISAKTSILLRASHDEGTEIRLMCCERQQHGQGRRRNARSCSSFNSRPLKFVRKEVT